MAEALVTKTLKEMRYSYYCVTPKNHRFLFVHENIKKHSFNDLCNFFKLGFPPARLNSHYKAWSYKKKKHKKIKA